jgi:lipopolysaccharide transport system ATP-binding protein
MAERKWQVGICGTFDVANYGDLLFPLIAQSELSQRLGDLTLHRFSYHPRTSPEWPYEVTSVAALPAMVDGLDGLLIGGGFLIRFDKEVAPGYSPPVPDIHHPTGYWLAPALTALQHNVPLVWNAPGMHCNDVPAWANPLMRAALTLSRYISVRDEPSRSVLERLTSTPVAVVPDTAFRLPRLLHLDGAPSPDFARLSAASGLDRPYIVLQATLGLEPFVSFIKKHAERFRNFKFLALPIGPALGERQEIIDADLPGLVRLDAWPGPLVIAELIARSEAVVGHSYHLFITALASGVPAFTRQNMSTGKYSALQEFETIFQLPAGGEPDPEWFLARVGRTAQCEPVRATWGPLERHWDRIADVLRAGPASTAAALNRFWASMPAVLENAAERENELTAALAHERTHSQERVEEALATIRAEAADVEMRLHDTLRLLAITRRDNADTKRELDAILRRLAASGEIPERRPAANLVTEPIRAGGERAVRDARIARIVTSTSRKLAAPVRFVGRQLRKYGEST